jgi:hypothetical protein
LLRTDSGADPEVEMYMRFVVTGVPAVAKAATLRIYATSGTRMSSREATNRPQLVVTFD